MTVTGNQANLTNHCKYQALIQEFDALEDINNLLLAISKYKQTISTLAETNASLAQELVSLRKEFNTCKRSSRSDVHKGYKNIVGTVELRSTIRAWIVITRRSEI